MFLGDPKLMEILLTKWKIVDKSERFAAFMDNTFGKDSLLSKVSDPSTLKKKALAHSVFNKVFLDSI